MLEILYLLIACFAIYLECSKKINTKSILLKAALLSIVIGCMLNLGDIQNSLIEFGAMFYVFMIELPIIIRKANMNNKRVSDRAESI